MTIEELIEELQKVPKYYDVCISDSGILYDIENVNINWNNNRVEIKY